MIDERFRRTTFEREAKPDALAELLSAELTTRLRAAIDVRLEAASLVDELRALGHSIFCWDEGESFSIWGDSYAEPTSPLRLVVEFSLGDEGGEDPSAEASFGPWPTDPPCSRR